MISHEHLTPNTPLVAAARTASPTVTSQVPVRPAAVSAAEGSSTMTRGASR
jgi:hypothetical protein